MLLLQPHTFRPSSAVILSALHCHLPIFPATWVRFAVENQKKNYNESKPIGKGLITILALKSWEREGIGHELGWIWTLSSSPICVPWRDKDIIHPMLITELCFVCLPRQECWGLVFQTYMLIFGREGALFCSFFVTWITSTSHRHLDYTLN